jgi:micrococcal nuclease
MTKFSNTKKNLKDTKVNKIILISLTIFFIGIVFCLLVIYFSSRKTSNSSDKYIFISPTIIPNAILEKAVVSYIFDGDTVELSDGRRVRFIGIDTPEMNFDTTKIPDCFALEATDMTKKLLLNQEIEMEKDKEDKDKYGRLLRYVYSEKLFINDFLVRQGYAKSLTIPPDTKYAANFQTAQEQAQNAQRGLWGKCKIIPSAQPSTSTQ